MELQEEFNRANDKYKMEGNNLKDRKKFFLAMVGNSEENAKQYHKLVSKLNKKKYPYSYFKEYLLKYQKNSESYKKYKKQYDIEYRNKNREYNGFRSTKSRLYKTYGEELGKIKLLTYCLKKQAKGDDMTLFLVKLGYIGK